MEINEHKAALAAARGARADSLLKDELLSEAFASLETSYIAAWRTTTLNDAAGREKLFLAINIVGKVKEHLGTVAAQGRLAAADLRRIAEAAEKKPEWHQVR